MKTFIVFFFILQGHCAYSQSDIPVAGPGVEPTTIMNGSTHDAVHASEEKSTSETIYKKVEPISADNPASKTAVADILNPTLAAANCSTINESNFNLKEDFENCKVEPIDIGNLNLLLPYLVSIKPQTNLVLGPVSSPQPDPAVPPTPDLNDAKKCQCLEDNEKSKVPPESIQAEEKKAKELIRKAVNQKLLIDYTRHFEDVRYYEKNLGRMFDGESSTKYACAQAEDLKTKVKDQDGCAGLTDQQINEKFNDVLESFHNRRLRDNFPENLKRIQKQILGNTLKKTDNYNRREEHDIALFSSNRENADFKIFDKVVTSVLKDQKLYDSVKGKSFNQQTPFLVILETFREVTALMSEDEKKSFFKKKLGEDLFYMLKKNIPQDAPGDFLAGLSITLGKASRLHPGISRFLTDSDLFRDASDQMDSTPKPGQSIYTSMMTLLESDKLMKEHFESSCDKLKDNFAQTVCANDEDLFKKMGPTELSQLLKNEKEPSKKRSLARSLFICKKVISDSYLVSKMLFNPVTDRPSKYYGLVTKVRDDVDVAVSHAMSEPKSEAGQALIRANQTYGNTAYAVPNDDVARQILGRDMKPSSLIPSNSSASPYETKNIKLEKNDLSESDSQSTFPASELQNQGIPKGSYVNPGTGHSAVINNYVVPGTKIESPKEMREFLKDESTPGNASRIVDDSSDEMMKELMKLKEETEANKIRILELSSDNERLKLKAAQEQLANLEKRREALDPGEPKSDGAGSTQRERSSLSPGIRENNREIASTSQSESGGVNAGSQGAAAPQLANSNSAAASVGGLNRALLATSGNTGRTDESSSPLVLSSGTTRTSGLEIKSQDVGPDLMDYISSNDSDLQTLINLKSSGLLYKYKTVVNGEVVEKELMIQYKNLNDDVKKLIDQKIALNKNRGIEALRLDREIAQMRRVNRYSALKIILGEQMKK